MGYNTRYKLVTDCPPDDRDRFHAALMEIEGAVWGLLTNVEGIDYDSETPSKWYEWREDLGRLSRDFPDVTLKLSGEGESQGDVWRAVFKAGTVKVIRPEMRWPTDTEVDAMTGEAA